MAGSGRAEVREAGTMTPPVRIVIVDPAKQRAAGRAPSAGPGRTAPRAGLTMVSAPLVRLRETTAEEWEVEDVLEVRQLPRFLGAPLPELPAHPGPPASPSTSSLRGCLASGTS